MHAAVIVDGDAADPMNFVARIRLLDPLAALARTRAFTFEIVDSVRSAAAVQPDLLLFQRACFGLDELDAVARGMRELRESGVAIAWELDDHLFCPDLARLITRNAVDEVDDMAMARTQAHRRLLPVVDAIVCSTQALADALRPMTAASLHVVPVLLDFDRARWSRNAAGVSGRRFRIGWAGGSRVGRDLELMVPALRRALARHAHAEFTYMGPEKYLPLFDGLPPERLHHSAWVDYDGYPAAIGALDLALAPLEPHAYNDCKSALKAIDAGAMGVPVICSAAKPYDVPLASIRGRADTEEDWDALLERSIRDPISLPARAAMRQAVRSHQSVASGLDHHWAVLRHIAGRTAS